MLSGAWAILLQAAAPPPDIGPDELVDYWPVLVRGGWFLLGFLVIAVIGWYVLEPIVSRAIRSRNPDNPTIQEAISRYLRLAVVLFALVVGAGVAGYGQVLADSAIVVAAATLAFGVAAQQIIASIVSGIVLVIDPEFNVGDHIVWEDGEGTVQSITLRVTRIRTPDGELVTLPNTVLTEQAITRRFGRRRYRIVDRVEVSFEDDLEAAMGYLQAATAEVDGVLERPAPQAYIEELGDDGVVIRMIYWVGDPTREDVARVRSAFALAAKTRLEAADVTISPASQHELAGRIEVDEGV